VSLTLAVFMKIATARTNRRCGYNRHIVRCSPRLKFITGKKLGGILLSIFNLRHFINFAESTPAN
jgi:hypothetical protein